jgi:ADP-ribose pyrophosphatase YjhB (NUDIX family)
MTKKTANWKNTQPRLPFTPQWKTPTTAYDSSAWINLTDTVEEYTTDQYINVGAYIFTHRPLSYNNFYDCEKMRKYGIWEELVVLLVEPNDRCRYSIPKGHLKHGELPHEGAMREIEQETGLSLYITETTPHITYSKFKENVTQIHYLLYVPYNELPEKLTPIDTHEIRFAFWATLQFIQQNIEYCNYSLTCYTHINPVIRLAFEFNENSRAHYYAQLPQCISGAYYTIQKLAEMFIETHIVSLHTIVAKVPDFDW